jgi:hypothetical protein
MKLDGSSRYYDCAFIGQDKHSGRFVVREQLYPEARGWKEHEFESEAEAKEWLEQVRLSKD